MTPKKFTVACILATLLICPAHAQSPGDIIGNGVRSAVQQFVRDVVPTPQVGFGRSSSPTRWQSTPTQPQCNRPAPVQPAPIISQPVVTHPIVAHPVRPLPHVQPLPPTLYNSVVVADGHSTIATSPGTATADPSGGDAAKRLIEDAKQLFRAGKYGDAILRLDEVAEALPENSDVLQFRGLTYFAQGEYDQAAADYYDALQFGNTWTWPAVYDVYRNEKVYTEQLRKLEAASKTDATLSKHFALAYQYLVLEHWEPGAKQLEKALAISPEEPLMNKLSLVVADLK